ncbi:MAG: T9SS type A sorting domain-containing protein [Flavobacteriales bacterium]|nr:T9SS type A sorting domain-containing protein [Flavobacteriales bacterium]
MRLLSTATFCSLICLTPALHAQFGPEHIVFTIDGSGAFANVVVADLDNDQDNDLVVGRGSGLGRMINLDGLGNFGPLDTITSVPIGVSNSAVGAGDMDGDGDVDLVVRDMAGQQLLLFPNEGAGSFGAPLLVASTAPYGFFLEMLCADITGSALPEVLILYQGTVRWFVNEAGTFPTTDSLQHATSPCNMLLLGDVDLDGDLDHTVSGANSNLYVGLNGGDGTSWTSVPRPDIPTGGYSFGHSLIDVDNDGDLDFVDAMSSVSWAENRVTDNGVWGEYIIHPIALSSNEGAGWSARAGCAPYASVFWNPWPYSGPLRWSHYAATLGAFTDPVLLTDLPTVGDARLFFGDLDGDGIEDLISTDADTLRWYTNQLTGIVDTPELDPLCASSGPYPLPDGTPAGGDWSGPWVVANVFDGASAPPGSYSLSYMVVDSFLCLSLTNEPLIVYPLPEADILSAGPFCADEPEGAILASVSGVFGGAASGTGTAGTVQPEQLGAGQHVYTFSVTDDNGCTTLLTDSFSVDICSGLADDTALPDVRIAPNPANGSLNVFLPGSSSAELRLLDGLGRRVLAERIAAGTARFGIEHLPSGIYHAHFLFRDGTVRSVQVAVR